MLRTRDLPIGLITEKPTESKTQLVPASRSNPTFHRYLELPPELLALIAIFWNSKDLHQFKCALIGFYHHYFRTLPLAASRNGTTVATCQPMGDFLYRQFKVAPWTVTLLRAVIDANYSQAQVAVDQNPSLMFESVVNFRYRDGGSESISPLKYAFKVYDTYMWKLFYKKIKKNPQYVKEFIKQAQEQTRHIDLAPLFAAYKEYEKQRQLWLTGEITHQEVSAAWLKVGAAQQLLLPVHMLKEFLREGHNMWSHLTFDVTVIPPPSNCWKTFPAIISDRGWGSSFSLVRGRAAWSAECAEQPHVGTRSMEVDSETFRYLFKVRAEDLVKQISLLSQNAHTSPELQTQHLSPASRVVP